MEILAVAVLLGLALAFVGKGNQDMKRDKELWPAEDPLTKAADASNGCFGWAIVIAVVAIVLAMLGIIPAASMMVGGG